MEETFNFVVAYLYNNDHMSCYSFAGDVQYGTQSEAETFLKYVKGKSPDREWQIFRIQIPKVQPECDEDGKCTCCEEYSCICYTR
jgi:hypothetical protein